MTRMNGYDAFLKIADIREDFLDEAYLPALFPAVNTAVKLAKKKKILAPLAALFSNHAVAAVLCGVLGLGVLAAVIGLSPLNPFPDPPVTEPPVTDTSDPDETPPVSEEGSETEPEAEEIGDPYELVFASNGDGTCRVSDIRVNPKYHEKFDLIIPATSPDGERVVSVENPGGFGYENVPFFLLPEDFEPLLYRVRTHFGADSMTARRFSSYFNFRSVEICSTENLKKDLLDAYPWAAVTDFYMLDVTTIIEVEGANISGWIAEAMPEFVAYDAEKRFCDLVTSHGYTVTRLDEPYDVEDVADNGVWVGSIVLADGIQTVGEGAFAYTCAASLTLPAGLCEIGDYAFENCLNLSEIRWPTEKTLKRIGEQAFAMCQSVTSVPLTGDGLTVGANAFDYCNIQEVTWGTGVVSVDENAIPSVNLRNLYILPEVTELPDGGFPWLSQQTSLVTAEDWQPVRFGDHAFHGLALGFNWQDEFVFPRSVTYIGEQIFPEGVHLHFRYDGTVAEWEAIEKHEAWANGNVLIIDCTDGQVQIGTPF